MTSPLPTFPDLGTTRELVIERLGRGGMGIARSDGVTWLVPKTLPGERVVAEVVCHGRRSVRLRLRRVLQASPRRTAPPCRHYLDCGGCHLQHLAYADQLTEKHDSLRPLGSEPVRPATPYLGYRTRNLFQIDADTGELGFVDPWTRRVTTVQSCRLAAPGTEELVVEIRAWLSAKDPEWRRCLRSVLVRIGTGGHRMLVLIVDVERPPTPDDLSALLARLDGVSTYLNLKSALDRAALGPTFHHLAGPRRLREALGPFLLELSPPSFSQVHPRLAASLYAEATRALAPRSDEQVLDLYSGSGGLAFHLATAAGHVQAVELDHRAVHDAIHSQALNALPNVDFRAGRCERIARRLWLSGRRFAAASLNPPRKGIARELPAWLPRLGVQRLVYLSCSPATLERDLLRLGQCGYHLERLVPFDMFAQTYHLELLAILERLA